MAPGSMPACQSLLKAPPALALFLVRTSDMLHQDDCALSAYLSVLDTAVDQSQADVAFA